MIIWKPVTCQRTTLKKYSTPKSAIRSGDTGQPKVVKKCQSKHWFSCASDGRRTVYGHVITKFSGMGRLIKLWGSAYAWTSAIITDNFRVTESVGLWYKIIIIIILVIVSIIIIIIVIMIMIIIIIIIMEAELLSNVCSDVETEPVRQDLENN